jgi:hypothetical protein
MKFTFLSIVGMISFLVKGGIMNGIRANSHFKFSRSPECKLQSTVPFETV